MKKLLSIIFLLFITLSCDKKTTLLDFPCNSLFIEDKDEFEGELMYKGHKLLLLDKSDKVVGFFQFLSPDLDVFYINLLLSDNFCVDNNTKVIFLFENGSTTDYFVKSEDNCKGDILLIKPLSQEFSNKLLKGFRIKTFDGYIDYYLSETSALELKKISSCFFDVAYEKTKNR